MLPKDLGKITSYIVGTFTDIFHNVDKHGHDSRKFKQFFINIIIKLHFMIIFFTSFLITIVILRYFKRL